MNLVSSVLCLIRVADTLNRTDPSSVNLDEAKAEQVLSLTNNMLLLICSQTPIMKKLIHSCQFIFTQHLVHHQFIKVHQ